MLSLLSDVADEQPLLCLVDDVQWLDRASAQALAFVGRRLGAESVALIVASRAPLADLASPAGNTRRGLAGGRCAGAVGYRVDHAAR